MKKPKEKDKRAIEAIEATLIKLDINYHKPLIDLLNEYNNKLKTQDNYVPLITSLEKKISICILENNLKIPTEVSKLIQTLNSLKTKFNLFYGLL